MTLTSYRKTLVILALAFIVSAGLWLGLFVLVQSRSEKLSSLEVKLAKLERDRLGAGELKLAVEETTVSRVQLLERVVTEDEVIIFIEQVEQLARESGVKVLVSNAVKVDKTLQFNLEAEGEFRNLYQYFLALENAPYALKLTEVSFVRNDVSGQQSVTGPSKGPWSASFNLKVASLAK